MRVFLLAAIVGGLCLPAMEAQNLLEKAQRMRAQRRALTVEEATEGTVDQQQRAAGASSPRERSDPSTVSPPDAVPPSQKTAAVAPTVQAAPPGPPQKNLTGREFTRIRVGATAKDVLTVLGPPASRVVVPDDDDHLRETLQYRVNGVPAATIRLDNGRVVQIDAKPQ